MQLRLPLAWLISRLWLTNNEPPICILWPWILRQDLWPFAFQRKNQYRQCATFSTALCICRRHCAVYGRKVGKIICCLRLPQFAAQQVYVQIVSSITFSGFFLKNRISLVTSVFAFLLKDFPGRRIAPKS